jgi:antirestriction protein
MNTEKLEKLKKSLDNKFIPDNVKDKIRNEIKNLESEIKSEDITATELKKEVAKVEEKVEVAVDKAEKKAESTEPKKGRGRPRKTPATTPVEPKATETAIKKTAMVVAKTIRKDGEKWNDAMKRANSVMKKEKVEVKKTTKSELDRLLARVRKNKSLMSELKGVKDLRRDAMRTAKPVGKRMSESGNVYYEYRANKTDRKTYGKYAFELGGSVVTDLAGHTGGGNGGFNPRMPLDGFSNTAYTGLVGETGAMSSGEMFMSGGGVGMANQQVIDDASQGYVNYYLGEGTAQGIYKDGGGIPNNYEGKSPKEVWELLTYTQKEHFLSDHLTRNQFDYSKTKGLTIKDLAKVSWDNLTFGIKKEFGEHISMGQYAKGGGVRKVGNREYSYGRNWTNDQRHVNQSEEHEVNYTRKGKFLGVFAKGGGVRQVGNREYSYGRNWTNDHRHTNKSEEHEVNYNRKRFFAGGGSVNDDTPKIYVADLEAYNNGRLSGVWLDLTDYSDADELMDAINDFLKTTGGEEYAVHDYENLPSSMYSEYMGVRDFEEIYEMMDLAKENDLPLDVVMEVVSQFNSSALNEYTGVYDSEKDFAEQLVDDLGGIQNFHDFEYYLEVSDTDRRLLSQEEADNYVDDIRSEDGGNRLIEEAGLDVEEYEEADSDRQEEMLDEAREIVYDKLYDYYFKGLSDPYYFLVEERGLYSPDDFETQNFVRVDYEKLADALEQDYTFVRHDGQIYVFNIR